jgi:hypothetical protein
MAIFLTSKTPAAVMRYAWEPAFIPGDIISSGTLTVSGGTIVIDSYSLNDSKNLLEAFISGGAAGETGIIAATAITAEGETLTETIYLPVVSSNAQIANTARSYCTFALRKIVGLGETPDATELEDALEQLNGLIAMWREGAADIGAAFPITADTVIYCPDWAVDAIRYNLRLSVYSLYDAQPSQMDAIKAKQGLQLIKHNNLPVERKAVYL